MAKKKKELAVDMAKQPLFKPVTVAELGTSNDPCFGKHYDLTTKECKMCGDSELCLVAFSQKMNKTRDELNEEHKFKDLDTLIDIKGAKKYIRGLKKKGEDKKEILNKVQSKYEITREDARRIYKDYLKTKKK